MKGEAEAAAMDVKAKAYRGYTEAALVDRLITSLPEVVAAVAAPLSKIDKITLISTGGEGEGSGMGMNRITADVVKVVAQVPALLESLSGVNVAELVKTLPKAGRSGTSVERRAQANGTAAKVAAPRPTTPPAMPASLNAKRRRGAKGGGPRGSPPFVFAAIAPRSRLDRARSTTHHCERTDAPHFTALCTLDSRDSSESRAYGCVREALGETSK